MIPYLRTLVDIRSTIMLSQVTGKKAIIVPIYKVVDRSVVGNNRPFSLTSLVGKQMEHVTVV